MSPFAEDVVLDFEIYLLMTMRFGLLDKRDEIEKKLSEHELSLEEGESIHGRMKNLFDDEQYFLSNLYKFLDIRHHSPLSFNSMLWPGYDFAATMGESGRVDSARYRRIREVSREMQSPAELPPWCMDVSDFAAHFDGAILRQQYSLSDKFLPAHDYYEFEWNGDRYGAGFSWGIFLSAARLWG